MTQKFLTILILANVVAIARSEDQRPNVVIVVADDMGWRDTGYQGSPYAKTPHLDALAAAGVRFDYFYSAGQMCSPGRYSILTGRSPYRGGVTFLESIPPQESPSPRRFKTQDTRRRTSGNGIWATATAIH